LAAGTGFYWDNILSSESFTIYKYEWFVWNLPGRLGEQVM
jgi:hypothetical protein